MKTGGDSSIAQAGAEFSRKIIHVDMDAFYVSVEQKDRPELLHRPIVVGGSPQSRAVVCSASYEARKYGVRSAMSCAQAYRLCPEALFIAPRFSRYRETSAEIRKIFLEVTPLVEPLSLDEAYLDVTQNLKQETSATRLAQWILGEIRKRLDLSASAGVGPNKLIAKMASEVHKPGGIKTVRPAEVRDFLRPLPVSRLWGVGPATQEKLEKAGYYRLSDLQDAPANSVDSALGAWGLDLQKMASGWDDRPVVSDWDSKSAGSETTFEEDVIRLETLEEVLFGQIEELLEELEASEKIPKTLTLKVKYADFESSTRSFTFNAPVEQALIWKETARTLLRERTEAGTRPIRLIGVQFHQLVHRGGSYQLWLPLPGIG